MRRLSVVLCMIALAACVGESAQTAPHSPDEDAILETVDAFFLAMAEEDAAALTAIVAPGATMVAIGYGEDGAQPPRRTTFQTFIDRIDSGEFGSRVHEAYWDPTVLQRADLAVVWTPYRIDIAGERLHCGVDIFNLSRENGKWLVDSLSFTMEPTACDEIKPGEDSVVRPDFSALDAKEN